MYFRNGGGSLSPGRPPPAGPESGAMSRFRTSAARADSARGLPPGSRPPSRAPEVALCRLRAHLGAPGPCPGGRLQVRRARPAGASPHARPPRRSPSPDLLCDGDLHGREKGPWARGWPAAPPPSGLRPPAAGRARSEPERANQAWAPGPRAARSSRRCGPAARLYPKVTLLYRPPLRSSKLKERQQTSRGKAASWLDSKGPYLGVLGSERRSGWSFPSCAQARSRDICFPYAPRHRQILDYMLPSSPPLVVFPTRPGR